MKKRKLHELKRPNLAEYRELPKFPVTLVLDNIRSGLNVGSVFRTADAFKIEQIFLGGITPQPPHREILKTAIGATDSVVWQHFDSSSDAIAELKKMDYHIIAVEQTDSSVPLQEWEPSLSQKIALIFGNEVRGVDDPLLLQVDQALEIPQFGTKHSLNISVSAGVVLWHYVNLQLLRLEL